MRGRKSYARLGVRLACLALAVALLWLPRFGPETPKYVVAASPFVSLLSTAAARTLSAASVVGFVLAVIVFIRKRWFCRYVCPAGLLQDGAARLGVCRNAWWAGCPPVGKYLVMATAAGAIFGYPLFLWMDPLALFSSAFSVRVAVGIGESLLSMAGLVLLLILAATSGDLWCARICPLGAAQELLARLRRLIGKKGTQAAPVESDVAVGGLRATRRAFMAVLAGSGMGLLARRTGSARGNKAPLRPPGDSGEDTFTGLCLRCGNCIRACPEKILHVDTGEAGIAGFLAPVVRFEDGYCLEDCNACLQVCPSGALENLSLEWKLRHRIGEALVDGSICLLVQGKSDCDVCVRVCPFDAIEIYWDDELYVAYPNVDFEKCNGCGACQVFCPTGDVKAIRVWKVEE